MGWGRGWKRGKGLEAVGRDWEERWRKKKGKGNCDQAGEIN